MTDALFYVCLDLDEGKTGGFVLVQLYRNFRPRLLIASMYFEAMLSLKPCSPGRSVQFPVNLVPGGVKEAQIA